MTLTRKTEESLLERGYSRRHIARIAMGAAAAIPFFSEFAQAQQAERGWPAPAQNRWSGADAPLTIRKWSASPPMRTRWGPCQEGIEAMAKVGPLGWRYSPQGENLEFECLLQSTENVKPGYVNGYPGSSIPLAQLRSGIHFAYPKLGDGQPGIRQRRGPFRRQQSDQGSAAQGLFARRGSDDQGRPECRRILHLQSQQSRPAR